MRKIGKKTAEWMKEKPALIKEYQARGITRCEISNSRFALDFHHIQKRSSQKAEHTFEGTRLLNQDWHDFCEYNKEANRLLIEKPRGFNKLYFEKFKAMKDEKKKASTKKAAWEQPHNCAHCGRICYMLICPHCGKMSIKK